VCRGQRQQEPVWETGQAPALSRRCGGTSCAELSAAAKPRCGGDAAVLPAAARARTRDEQKHQPLSGQPRRGQARFRRAAGPRLRSGSRDEAGGPGSPLPAAATAGTGDGEVMGDGNKPPV